MNIQPIVEGYGDVDALPVLMRRLRDTAEAFTLDVNPPIRKPRAQFTNERQLRTAVRLARRQEDCKAILILFDSDDDCPAERGPQVLAWAQEEAGDLPCRVVLAHREFEAWFLAAIESLRGIRGIRTGAESHVTPEMPRGAKAQIEERMENNRSYSETVDQPAFAASFDMAATYRNCRSFRHLVKAFGELVVALGVELPASWPPATWLPEEVV
jgi:hypothetical protein